jgi:GNAT superfamily N-acetyltransferase
MLFPEITRSLPSGKTITLRSAFPEDAQSVLEYVRGFVYDAQYVPLVEGEFNLTIEQEEALLQSYIDRDNCVFIIALCDGKIVGNLNLEGHSRQILRHTAMLGMGTLLDWRGFGIGKFLMEEALTWAKGNKVLEQIWLEVYEEHEVARKLYRDMGFIECGRIPNKFKFKGKYSTEIKMILDVK